MEEQVWYTFKDNYNKDNQSYYTRDEEQFKHFESEDKGKLYRYEHCCGKYYIHQNCLHEWILKNGNDCIVCRKNAFTNPETIAFLTMLLTLRDQIENI